MRRFAGFLFPLIHLITRRIVDCFDEECIQNGSPSPTCIVTDNLPLSDKGELNFRAMASVGNGYLATVIMSDEIHVSGVFNGRANVIPDERADRFRKIRENRKTLYPDWYYNHTHRARIPNPVSINYTLSGNRETKRLYILDVKNGYFAQVVDNDIFTIHQRTYAHRSFRNILVTEIEINVKVVDNLNFTVQSNVGPESRDINFEHVSSTKDWELYKGPVNQTEYENSQRVSVALLHTKIPKFRILERGLTRDVYITSISTSLDDDGGDDPRIAALESYTQAKELSDKMELFQYHVVGWNTLWLEGGNITIEDDVFLAQTVFTSFYYILSSVRDDWEHGLSPGSLAMGYEYMGHSFWDQETWMYPALLMFHPSLGRSLLNYRVYRLQQAVNIAHKYHFKGEFCFFCYIYFLVSR